MERKSGRRQARPEGENRRKNRRAGRFIGGFFLVLLTLFLVGICTVGMMAGIFMKYVETSVMPTTQVDAADYTMALSSFIYYHDDEVTANDGWVEYQTIYGDKNRVWVSLDEMPEALWKAAVAIEDERFFQHQGVDWRRTGYAVANMFIGMRNTFGGSTITQQMLKNMTEDWDGTVNRKVREIFRALEFEKDNTKWQILELYLNMIYLGKGCYGVQTAAQFYFGKDVGELSTAECASLIAITNNPSMYGPMYDIEITVKNADGTTEIKTPRQLNKKRQELILDKMAEVGKDGKVEDGYEGFITKEEAESAKAEALYFTDGSTDAEAIVAKATGGLKVNNWFVDEVIRDVSNDLADKYNISVKEAQNKLYNSGYKIYTTMDPEIQDLAESVYQDRNNLDNLTSRDGQPIQSGITVLDPYTGDIKAIVGAMGEKEGNLLSNYATMKKQVGSSIKPLTAYAPAIDAGVVTPGTAFDDYPVRLLNDTYWPKNSPNRYRGFTQVNIGVRNSINTIALQTLQTVGTTEAFAFATEKLNLGLVAEDMDESPLAMGGLTQGLSTVEMAAAYAPFVNQGIYNEPRTYLRVEDASGQVILENESESHVAMKETTAYLMNQMLKDAVAAGTGTQARFNGMTIAGKTGTTNDNYARYFVGYTPYYVAAVWTGYKSNAKISYSGGNPAITMWKKVMEPLHAELEKKDFLKPESGLTTVSVCADSGLLCTDACLADVRGSRQVTVTIASGTGPTEKCNLHVFRDYCTEGECLATEFCPTQTVVQKGVLNHVREEYDPNVKAEDDAYVLSSMEKAIGLQPTIAEDGTEVYPEVIGCPVHTTFALPDPEFPYVDPNDPNNGIPPWNIGDPDDTENTDQLESGVPAEPAEPDILDDDWWNALWNGVG